MQPTHPDMKSPGAFRGIAITSTLDIRWVWIALMAAAMIKFSNSWIWTGGTMTSVGLIFRETDVPLYIFQSALWVSILAALVWDLSRHGMAPLTAILQPVAVFASMALACTLFGEDPMMSLRVVLLWVVTVVSGSLVGRHLRFDDALGTMLWVFFFILFLSVFLSASGLQEDAEIQKQTGWRGLFVHKNAFGWVASLMLAVALSTWTRARWRLPTAVCALAVIGLLGAKSGTSLVAGACVLGHVLIYRALQGRVSWGLSVLWQVSYLVGLVLLSQLVMPVVLDILGKDPTLTGRTEIWGIYIEHALEHPWFGQGPGTFSGKSVVTEALLNQLGHLGEIYTPHNMYIAVLGDAGVLGLLTFLVTVFLLVFGLGHQLHPLCANAIASLGVLFLISGMAETREVFNAGFHWFLMFVFRSLGLQAREVRA